MRFMNWEPRNVRSPLDPNQRTSEAIGRMIVVPANRNAADASVFFHPWPQADFPAAAVIDGVQFAPKRNY
jgi:hypothetical protein